jgi:hypothetical protein
MTAGLRPELEVYLERLRMQAYDARDFSGIPKWLTNHTTDPMDPSRSWSFHEHEYQPDILADTCPDIAMQKCSQVGASEIWVRMMLAMMAISKKITIIYILPTSALSKRFAQGRINPVLEDSKTLKAMIDKDLNNNEQKRIGRSLLYISGTFGKVAAISVPAQALFRDEVDFCNQRVLTTFDSRLGHSKQGDGLKRSFSTPTVFRYGINLMFEEGSQAHYATLCPHCGEWMILDYFRDVVIPGFEGTLRDFEKSDLSNPEVKILDAFFLCPRCRHSLKHSAFMNPERRQWIHTYESRVDKHSYQVIPIDVPAINPLARTLLQINDYDSKKDWVNFKLGLPSEDAASSFLDEEMTKHATTIHVPRPEDGDFKGVRLMSGTYFGLDVGKTCWLTITQPNDRGGEDVLYQERIRQDGDNYVAKRTMQLFQLFGCVCGVVDSGPDTTLAQILVKAGAGRIYACRYYTGPAKSLKTLDVLVSRDEEEGLVTVNRTALYDNLVRRVNKGNTRLTKSCAEYDLARAHFRSFKRIETRDMESGESLVQWVATGDDHYTHSLGYADVARRIIAVPPKEMVVPYIPTLGRVSLKSGDDGDDRSDLWLPPGFKR